MGCPVGGEKVTCSIIFRFCLGLGVFWGLGLGKYSKMEPQDSQAPKMVCNDPKMEPPGALKHVFCYYRAKPGGLAG